MKKTVSKTHTSLSHVIWTIEFNPAPKPILKKTVVFITKGSFHYANYTSVAVSVKVVT